MIQLSLPEKIYIFKKRIKLLTKLLKLCENQQNIKYFGIEDILAFNPKNVQNRLENGIKDLRSVENIISEADDLWEDIKKVFINEIKPSEKWD